VVSAAAEDRRLSSPSVENSSPSTDPVLRDSQQHPLVRIVAGALVGGAALWLTFRNVSAEQLMAAMARMDFALAAAAFASSMGAVGLFALRWKLLFAHGHGQPSFGALFRATVVGQMLNIASPVRVGELSRLYAISRFQGVPLGGVLATLALEKAIELAVFGTAAVTLITMVAVPREIVSMRALWIVMPLVAGAILAAAAGVGPRLARRLAASRGMPAALSRQLVQFSESFATAVLNATSVRRGGALLLLSLSVMLLPALANQLLLYAFDLHLPVWTGLALLIVLQVGSVPPSLPGRLGIFNYLTMVTLAWMGVDPVIAAAYSVALYVIAYAPKLLLGALFLAFHGGRQARRVAAT
jgi:uncharacterized protein (TIRG00374 family)